MCLINVSSENVCQRWLLLAPYEPLKIADLRLKHWSDNSHILKIEE